MPRRVNFLIYPFDYSIMVILVDQYATQHEYRIVGIDLDQVMVTRFVYV